MIYELERSQYGKVRSLFQGLWYHLAIFSVLEGNSPGRVLVNDAHDPRTAFVWDQVEGGFYLGGDAGNRAFNRALNTWILEKIYPEAREIPHLVDFTLNYEPEIWMSELDVILEGTRSLKHQRKHFALERLKIADWRAQIPAELEMVRVDGIFLTGTEMGNMEDVCQWVMNSWQSIENFEKRGVGFCLIHGDTIASWCIGDYVADGGKAYEIGIQTDEDYRRQGLAALTVAAAVDHCLSRGVEHVGWHCWSSNLASAATARKVGFAQTIEHPVYHAWYNRFDNLLVQANFCFQWEQYEETTLYCERALAMQEQRAADFLDSSIYPDLPAGWLRYRAASAWALLREYDAAFAHLHGALNDGWRDWDRAAEDDAFASLRQMPEWRALIDGMQK